MMAEDPESREMTVVVVTVVLGVVFALGSFALFWAVTWWLASGRWGELAPVRWSQHRRTARRAVTDLDAEYARLVRDWRGGAHPQRD